MPAATRIGSKTFASGPAVTRCSWKIQWTTTMWRLRKTPTATRRPWKNEDEPRRLASTRVPIRIATARRITATGRRRQSPVRRLGCCQPGHRGGRVGASVGVDVGEAGGLEPGGGLVGGGDVVDGRVEPAGQGLVGGAEGEHDSAAGAQHAGDLGEGGRRVGPEVDGVYAEHGVGSVVGQRQGNAVAVV